MLDRYFSVLEKRKSAVHWVTRSVECGIDDRTSASEEELRDANAAGVAKFRDLKGGAADAGLEPLEEGSLLDLKLELSRRILTHCAFCERRCGVDRTGESRGTCGVGAQSRYSSDFLHMGEEP